MGIVNRIQNAWNRQQLFNPGTLVLRAVDGSNITINGRPGEDRTIAVPMVGTLFGNFVALATVDQVMTTTHATINFNTTVNDFGACVSRVGGVFTVLKKGWYTIFAECAVLQGQNNNIFKIWVAINGTAIEDSATLADIGNAGTSDNPIFFLFYYPFNIGDVVTMKGLASIANGCTLDYNAAAGAAPGVVAARISFDGYLGA